MLTALPADLLGHIVDDDPSMLLALGAVCHSLRDWTSSEFDRHEAALAGLFDALLIDASAAPRWRRRATVAWMLLGDADVQPRYRCARCDRPTHTVGECMCRTAVRYSIRVPSRFPIELVLAGPFCVGLLGTMLLCCFL